MPYSLASTIKISVLSVICSFVVAGQSVAPGIIQSDSGGAVGYQHGLTRSRFLTGAQPRVVNKFGYSKVVGPLGVLATSLHNGMVIGIPIGQRAMSSYALDPSSHNQKVLQYFRAAGLPENQIAGVHATTFLSASGRLNESRAPTPKIDGYRSNVERKVDKYPVVDSVAWAQLDEQGNVVAEGVYWPAVPAQVIADAKRLEGILISDGSRQRFLARLPSGLPPGRVVIRHSSASVDQGSFEVFASYEVQDRQTSADSVAVGSRQVASVTRHFDVDGVERRLPQERRNLGADYPTASKPRPADTPNK